MLIVCITLLEPMKPYMIGRCDKGLRMVQEIRCHLNPKEFSSLTVATKIDFPAYVYEKVLLLE